MVVQVEDVGKEIFCLQDRKMALLALVEVIEELLNVVESIATSSLTCPLHASSVVVEDNGEQHVHQEENSKDYKGDKVESVPRARVVGREHHVWEVGGRDEHSHLVVGVPHRVEQSELLEGAIDDEVSNRCEVANVDENAGQDDDGVFEVVDHALQVLSNRAEKDDADPGPTQVVHVRVLVKDGCPDDVQRADKLDNKENPVADFLCPCEAAPLELEITEEAEAQEAEQVYGGADERNDLG